MSDHDAQALGPLGDLPSAELRAYLHRMADWVADYREGIDCRSIVPRVRAGEIAAATSASMPGDPAAMAEILDDLDAVVMPGIVHWGHPAFLGYFGSTSNGPALLGEIAAAALNVSAMTWKTSPAATELETVVLGWIREMVALPATFTGVVYDTASVAVLHALAAAREAMGIEARARGIAGRSEISALRAYASDQAHSSLEKAMVVLGLGEENVVRVPSDADFRMDVDALRIAMDADVARGLRPMAVVATVGTTSSASVDPVREIAEVCRQRGAWLHVDAAYGGALAVLPEGRWAMDGAELADSVVVNPHKWLFTPVDCSALWTRRPEAFHEAFALVPDYLAATEAAIDLKDYGPALGRRFRALKLWAVLRWYGGEGLRALIREHVRLAQLFASLVEGDPAWEVVAPHPFSTVCFRRRDGDNDAIARAATASGELFVATTKLRGQSVIRLAIGNAQTTEADIRRAWEVLRSCAAA